jgi:hypothetical protein
MRASRWLPRRTKIVGPNSKFLHPGETAAVWSLTRALATVGAWSRVDVKETHVGPAHNRLDERCRRGAWNMIQ